MKVNSSNSHLNTLNSVKENSDKALQNIAAKRALSGEDGANLLVADSLALQSSTLMQGIANANDAIGALSIADSTLSNLSRNADRIGELSASMNSAILNDQQKSGIKNEISSLKDSMKQSLQDATFNGKNVFGSELKFFTGNSEESINLNVENIDNIDENNPNSLQNFRDNLNTLRTEIGSAQNGILAGINSNLTQSISLKQSESNIENNDVAKNLNQHKQNNNQINAAILAQAHNINNLQAQIDRLLA